MSKLKNIPSVTDIPAVDLAIELIGREGHSPELVYASMCDAVPDLLKQRGPAFEQHLFAMGYVLSIMHIRQALDPANFNLDPNERVN